MIQELLTGIVIAGTVFYLLLKLRKTGSSQNSPCGGCTSKYCNGCPAIDLKAEADHRKQQRKNFSSQYHNEKNLN